MVGGERVVEKGLGPLLPNCYGQKQLGKRRSKVFSFAVGQTCHTLCHPGNWVSVKAGLGLGWHVSIKEAAAEKHSLSAVAEMERNCQKGQVDFGETSAQDRVMASQTESE